MRVNLRHCRVFAAAMLCGLTGVASSVEFQPGFHAAAPQNAHGLLVAQGLKPVSEMPTLQSPSNANPQREFSFDFQAGDWSGNSANLSNIAFFNDAPPPVDQPLAAGMNAAGADCIDCCPDPLWCHRSGAFADLLYLRPGNIDYVYAVEQTGPLPTDSPTGPTGRVGFDGSLGFRMGLTSALTDCSSLQASYTWFQADTQNTIDAAPGTVLIFQPGDPSIANVGASSIQASAEYDIRFQQVDLDYRGLLYGTCDSSLNYFAGLRYANLKQDFLTEEDIGAPVGLSTVGTSISFDGFGIGFGLDGMCRSPNSGILLYGRTSASFVSGEFKANYRQTAQFVPNGVVGNRLVDFRALTILQAELGTGWQSESGRVRITAGYQFAGWLDSLTTESYILGVQDREFANLNETIAFDGLVTRLLVEY